MTHLQKHLPSFLLGGLVLILLIAMPGCATQNPEKKVLATHEMLVKAGFTFKEAKTPEQREQFSKMPQRKLLRHARGDETAYYYADVSNCSCVFVGDEADIEHLDKLKHEAKSDARREQVSEGGDFGVFYGDTATLDDIDDGLVPGF